MTLDFSGRTFTLTVTTVSIGTDFIVINGNITADAASPATIIYDDLGGADAACSFTGPLSVGSDRP